MSDNIYWCAECCDDDVSYNCIKCPTCFCVVCAEGFNYICPWCGAKIVKVDEDGEVQA